MDRRIGAVLIAAALVLAAVEASGARKADSRDEVAAWFSGPGAKGYDAAKPAAEEAAQAVRDAGVPESLLVERLAEGSAKQVPVDLFEDAIRREAERLVETASVVDRILHGISDDERTEILREGAIALRGGTDLATVEQALGWCVGAKVDPQRTAAALAAVASLKRGLALTPGDEMRLLQGVALSREKPQRFGSFVSLLAGARARGLATETILSVTLSMLSRGGTFLAVQQELERRQKK